MEKVSGLFAESIFFHPLAVLLKTKMVFNLMNNKKFAMVITILAGLFITINLFPQETYIDSNALQAIHSKMDTSEKNEYLLEESIKQNWDGERWIDAWQNVYTYGSNNKVTSQTYSTWYETNWNYYWMTIIAYNENNKIIEILSQRWNGDNWLPNSKSVNDYDENKQLTETINYLYDNRWIESSRLLFTYDTTKWITPDEDTIKKTIEQKTQIWNGYWVDKDKTTTSYTKKGKDNFPVESVTQIFYISYWADQKRLLYKYDSLFNLTEHVQQVPGIADWENIKRNVYKYDGKNMTEDLYQTWGGFGDDVGWINVKIHQNTYNVDTLLDHVYKEWIGSEWLNISRNVYSYANDTISDDLFQIWSEPNWVNDQIHCYTIDANKCRTEDLHKRWNGAGWTWWERELFFYKSANVIEPFRNKNVPIDLLTNYPNPFNTSTTIKYTIPREGFVTLTIYNSSGKVIKNLINEHQSPGQYNVILMSHDMETGTYFYTLQFEGYRVSKKMILVK